MYIYIYIHTGYVYIGSYIQYTSTAAPTYPILCTWITWISKKVPNHTPRGAAVSVFRFRSLEVDIYSFIKMRASISLLLIFSCGLLCICAGNIDVAWLRDCLGDSVAPSEKNHKHNRKSFFLSYGESGIEYFNVLRKSDMEHISKLALCVQQMDQSSISSSGNATITVLTGLLQSLLPTEASKITSAIRQGLVDADWVDRGAYGIRHAYLWTHSGPPLSERPPPGEHPDVFVVASRRAREEAAERQRQEKQERRDQRDAALRSNMFRDDDSVYLAVIPLTPRNQYIGGQVLIDHPLSESAEEEAMEDGDMEEGVFTHIKGGLETHTPEAGNLLLVPMAQRVLHTLHPVPRDEALLVGFEPIHFGEARLLVLELWSFRDAPFGTQKADRLLGETLGVAQHEGSGRSAGEL